MGTNLIEFTEYHSPDGLIHRFDTHTRFMLTETGLGMPPIEYFTQTGPLQHGNTIVDYRLRPRVIQMMVRENGCSREDYWAIRSNLINMIRPNRQTLGSFSLGKLRKYLPGNAVRDIDVTIEEGPAFVARELGSWDEYSYSETIRFIAPDPTFYDPSQVLEVISLPLADEVENLQFPFDFEIGVNPESLVFGFATLSTGGQNITYNGTWKAYPTITIVGPMGGAYILNNTTGDSIKLNYEIVAGETVAIGLSPGSKSVTSSISGDMIGALDVTSDLATFHLAPDPEAPGGVNVIYVSGTNMAVATSLTFCYYTRYIGI